MNKNKVIAIKCLYQMGWNKRSLSKKFKISIKLTSEIVSTEFEGISNKGLPLVRIGPNLRIVDGYNNKYLEMGYQEKFSQSELKKEENKKTRRLSLETECNLKYKDLEQIYKDRFGICDICGCKLAPLDCSKNTENKPCIKDNNILCQNCNLGLDCFKNSAINLGNAASYILKKVAT